MGKATIKGPASKQETPKEAPKYVPNIAPTVDSQLRKFKALRS
jgi:hypothetical protein